MSLVISITCAVLATLLQQWARRYLKVTQTRFSLHKRARIRKFFAEGVEKSLLPWVVEALPTLIHVSLVLFFAGLAVFLWNVNLTIFKVVLSWIGVCTALYGCTMLISIVRRDSPYYTPLTPLALPFVFVIGFVPSVVGLCYGLLVEYWTHHFGGHQLDRFNNAAELLFDFLKMTFMAPEKVALKSPPELDARALMWTFSRLDDDHELARFFSGLPGLHTSKVVKDPLRDLDYWKKRELLAAMIGFLDRTFSSDLLPDRVKHQRVDFCEKAIDLVRTYDSFLDILRGLACAHYSWEPVMGPAQSTEIVQFVQRWGNRNGENGTTGEAIFSIAVARVQRRDDSWFVLASNELGVPEAVLRSHDKYDKSLSLVILIHIIRQQFIYFWINDWSQSGIACAIKSASQFYPLSTSRKLQHEFCALWNQIVRKAQNDNDPDHNIPWWILHPMRGIYISLHQGTDSAPTQFSTTYNLDGAALEDPSMYPLCIDPSHILDNSTPTTFPRTVEHYDDALATASRTSPAAPSLSLSAPAPPHVDENLAAVPLLDDSHLTGLTPQPVDCLHISLTSLGPSIPGTIQYIVTSGTAASYTTPETSISTPPRPSACPPAAASIHDKVDPLAPSDSPNFPLTSSDPILDVILPTGPSLSSHSPITRSDQSPSFPESHPSIMVASAPSASLVLASSGPDPGTPAEDNGGGPIPNLRQENDVPDPPSMHHAIDANSIPTPDPPPQCSSLPSVMGSDVDIPGCSLQELNAGLTGDRPPDPSLYQYDMV
jgi:hypothetical protein